MSGSFGTELPLCRSGGPKDLPSRFSSEKTRHLSRRRDSQTTGCHDSLSLLDRIGHTQKDVKVLARAAAAQEYVKVPFALFSTRQYYMMFLSEKI
jgi:hypothetical protein